jgi:hypothetical protein
MIRIANCSGFYGDRISAAKEQVLGGEIDVLTGDYLAELTMLILFKDRMKNSDGGYAKTFLAQLKDVLQPCLEKKIKIVVNAGGLNPAGLAKAVQELATALKLSPSVATVQGDNVLEHIFKWQSEGMAFPHLDTGAPLAEAGGQLLAANAYVGCWPIVRALNEGADIVITGRCTDAAVVMAPAAWRHGWKPHDYDALAGALVAGHIIECGCQATGGNYPFFEEVPSFERVGFPIAEIASDGSSVITKHSSTGGLVSVGTVTAQLMYEIQGKDYFSPDTIARLDSVRLEQVGADRVKVHPVLGRAPTDQLKLGVNLAAGWRNRIRIVLGGYQAEAKAKIVEETFWPLVGGRDSFEDTRSELFHSADSQSRSTSQGLSFLELSARDANQKKVGRLFSSKAIELALASVPGITLAELPGRPQGCGVFWPTLIDRDLITPVVTVNEQAIALPHPPISASHPEGAIPQAQHEAPPPTGQTETRKLGELIGARSGDKGGNANVGFWVKRPEHYQWMTEQLSVEQLQAWLSESDYSGVVHRYEFPHLLAINFVIEGILGEGVAANLHPDPQAKCLAEFFRAQALQVDTSLLD